jgi:hypothetical protein
VLRTRTPNVFHTKAVPAARSGPALFRNLSQTQLSYHSGHRAARQSHRQTLSGCAGMTISLRAWIVEF